MSEFSTSSTITTPSPNVLQTALAILINSGFAILTRDETSATLSGPGLNSTRQNPLHGATKIKVVDDGHKLSLDAELGGADRMQRFVNSVPLAVGLFTALLLLALGLQFGWLFGVGFGVPGFSGWSWLMMTFGSAVLMMLPWIFLSPMMSKSIRDNTEFALKAVVTNAIQMSKQP